MEAWTTRRFPIWDG